MTKILSYLKVFATAIKERRALRWASRFMALLLFVVVFANFLANDKPYFCIYEGEWYAPIFKSFSVDLGFGELPSEMANRHWNKLELDWALWAPVPYTPKQKDLKNRLASPFQTQKVKNIWFRHWLGTDSLGRDVLAILISGTRTAILIGFGAALVAGIIGVFLGSLAGFYGDSSYQLSRIHLYGLFIGGLCGAFYGFISRQHLWFNQQRLTFLLGGLGVFFVLTLTIGGLFKKLKLGKWSQKRINIPIDLLVMRSIETLNALPALLLLLSIVAIIPKPSVISIILIIGLLTWTGIARFLRGELLRIRSLEYIEAGKTLGYKPRRILWNHALPNAMGPVFVTLTFAIAGAILTEASLSFLGIGMPSDVMTWGRLLSEARQSPMAWWLAVFPGLAISMTILTLYSLGEFLSVNKS